MDLEQFNTHRTTVTTSAGELAYVDVGSGPVALFVHGILLSSYLWSDAIGELHSERRCLALDLPGHGRSPLPDGQSVALPALADALEAFCAALDLDAVDLVANDTGGAVSQIFATRHPERLRTLTLTNCDANDQIPPETFKPVVQAAQAGQLAPALVAMHADPEQARAALAQGYEHPERLSDETIREYFGPSATLTGARRAERALTALDAADLIAIEPQLAELDTPTLIAWGNGDVVFDMELAHWLENAIGGAQPIVEIDGAKLFWPDERAGELTPLLREHWAAHAALGPAA